MKKRGQGTPKGRSGVVHVLKNLLYVAVGGTGHTFQVSSIPVEPPTPSFGCDGVVLWWPQQQVNSLARSRAEGAGGPCNVVKLYYKGLWLPSASRFGNSF